MSDASSSANSRIHLCLTSDTEELARVRAAVKEAARAVGFTDIDISSIALAIDEAITNIIRHGYQGRGGQPIELDIAPAVRDGQPALEVVICDCARQVDPQSIAGRDLEDVRPGGLGTHIIRTVMDEVEYSPRETVGMRLRLLKIKRIAPTQEMTGQ